MGSVVLGTWLGTETRGRAASWPLHAELLMDCFNDEETPQKAAAHPPQGDPVTPRLRVTMTLYFPTEWLFSHTSSSSHPPSCGGWVRMTPFVSGVVWSLATPLVCWVRRPLVGVRLSSMVNYRRLRYWCSLFCKVRQPRGPDNGSPSARATWLQDVTLQVVTQPPLSIRGIGTRFGHGLAPKGRKKTITLGPAAS